MYSCERTWLCVLTVLCGFLAMMIGRKLVGSQAVDFHDAFLEALRVKFDTFPTGVSVNGVQQQQSQTVNKESQCHRWQRAALQRFLGVYLSEYQRPQCFASLWTLLLSQLPEQSKHPSLDALVGDEHEHAEFGFDALKNALKQHASARLLAKDPFPLEQELVLDAKQSKRKGGGYEDELELPKLQNAVPKRSSLPVFTRPTAAVVSPPGRHSIAVTTTVSTSAFSAQKDSDSHNNTPVLQDFHAEVMKKSRNWLGRWQTRYLFLRWGELEICKKNVSAFRPGQPVSAQQPAAAPTLAGSTGSGGSAANAAKSKRYPLQTLLSLQIVQLNESDPSKKQALSLHFKQPTANGGNTTKSLILGCDSSDHLKTVVIQIATFAMLYGLASGQDAASLSKFIQVGANLDIYCLIPSPNVPPFALSPLQLAFLQSNEWKPQSFESTVQLLVRAGADPRSLLHWKFATQVLFSSAYGPDDEMLARRLLMVRESIDGVVLPFGGVIADDEHQWNLLMYFSCFGDVEGARQLLTTFIKISKSKCLKYVDHVNSTGDNALHIAIKTSRNHPNAEDLAMLLVDIGTNNGSFLSTAAASSSGETSRPSITPSLTSSSSYVDSQLIHCCDGNGESVFHLALKGRLWRLVDKLIDCKAIDPTSCDRHGNNSLHVAIKVGAPVHLIARIIQLHRPHQSSAFNSVSTERSNLVTTLGYDCRDRRGNDTPLSLAIKYRQQEVVELLLAAGATPNVGDCVWSTEAVVAMSDSPTDTEKIGDGDSPLHVAIKSGLQNAAMPLVTFGANLLIVDANGASPLALAIRYGMYELSVRIAEKLVNKEASSSREREREQKQWMDLETGAPMCLLAVRAGQIELAAMLLDLFNGQMSLSHVVTKETLLHVLVKSMCWLELSGATFKGEDLQYQDDKDADKLLSFGKEISPTEWKRSRVKSRSDGDLRHLQLASLIPSSPPRYSSQTLKKASSSDANEVLNQDLLERVAFFQQAVAALILGILQRSDDVSVITSSSKSQHAHVGQSSFHLATSPSMVVTDHNVDSYTPLYVAAAGGEATSSILCLFLAFLYVKLSHSRLEMAQALAKTTGSKAETPLHAALVSNSARNGLQVLLTMQLARGKQVLPQATSEKRAGELKSASAADSNQIASIFSHVYEAMTVPDGSTPLHLACRWPLNEDMLHVIDLLFQEDVYAGCWDSEGLTPLHVALQNGCDERLIQLFKRHNQDLNTWTEGRADPDASEFSRSVELSTPKTALMLAIESENAAAFSELVRCGAQLKVITPQTRLGLLHFAVQRNLQNKELLVYLLGCRKLIEYDVTDCFGRTTADIVKSLEEQLKLVNGNSPPDPPVFKRTTSVVLEDPDEEIANISSQRQHKLTDTMASPLSSNVALATPESITATTTTTTQLGSSQSLSISHSSPPASSIDPRAENQVYGSSSSSDVIQRRQESNQSSAAVEQQLSQITELPKTLPPFTFAGSTSKAKSAACSPPRNPRQGTTQYLQSLPQAPGLDTAAIEFLREEERATLTLVAHEARQEAKDWLKKRIGQKKLLSDARAQLQSFQKHRRTGSGSIPYPKAQEVDPADGTYAVPGPTFGQENERLLEQYKALAAKKFIDKHVAETVAEARMEIEREKQALFQETGLYPGSTVTKSSSGGLSIRREGLNRTASSSSSTLFSSSGGPRTESNATLLSDESNASVWWSERGGSSSFYGDDMNSTWLSANGRGGTMLSEGWNGTWLSSLRGTGIEYRDTHLSSTFHSFLETETGDPYGVDGIPGVTYVTDSPVRDDRQRMNEDEDWEDEYMNPLDRDSFSHVIETRNSLT